MLQAVLGAVRGFVTEHFTLSVFILAVVASVFNQVLGVQIRSRVITITKFIWSLVKVESRWLPTFLWSWLFFILIGYKPGGALFGMVIYLLLNVMITTYSELVLVRFKAPRTITVVVAVVALMMELYFARSVVLVFPGFEKSLPIFLDRMKYVLIIGSIGCQIFNLAAWLLLKAYPSKSATNVKAPEIPSIKGMSGDDAVRSVLASALKLLPEGKNVGWVVRQLLKLQKFIFKPLLAGFFAGGVFLESLMMLVLHWIHLGHVYVIWLYRQFRPVKA